MSRCPPTPDAARTSMALGPLSALGALTVVVAGGACGGSSGQSPVDASADHALVDVPPVSDVSLRPLALDFSATGCVTFDLAASRCAGIVPLTLVFTPIASGELTEFLWSFGDQTASSPERSPRHTYVAKGQFAVTLTAGGGPGVGSVKKVHMAYVDVAPAPAGAACDVDQQCADNRSCWCGSSGPCTPVLSRGLCGQACDAAAGGVAVCPTGTTCADLSTGTTPAAGSGAPPIIPLPSTNPIWRRSLCLPACTFDSECSTGTLCRELPTPAGIPAGTTSANTWVRACFGSYPLEIGSRCGDDTGKPVDADCASQLCANLGAFGRCAADCSQGTCPSGSTCAHFGDGRSLCLANCVKASACSDDPLLACETATTMGPLGFTVAPTDATSAVPASTYCAPKHCQIASDCGTAGTCVGGHCQPS